MAFGYLTLCFPYAVILHNSQLRKPFFQAKRVDRLTRLEVILSVYNALLKKHEPKLWALLPKRDEKAKKLSDKYDFNVPGERLFTIYL